MKSREMTKRSFPRLFRTTRRAPRAGIALVMVLCALFLLSLVIFGLATRVKDETFVSGRDDRSLDARTLSFTGLQIALHPLATVKTPALHHQLDSGHQYQAQLTGEGGKLNLNWLLVNEDQKRLDLLKTYLENKGLSFQEREVLVDCLLDWIKPGDTHHLNGSKIGLDGQPVPGRPFQDLAEVTRVVGSRPLTHLSGWDKDFTLLSQGAVDLQWASEEVIGALPGVGLSRGRQFVRQRRGQDGLDGTPDDIQLTQGDTKLMVPQLLGLSQNQYDSMVAPLIMFNDPTVRIVSVGQAYDVKRTLEVVARKQGMQPQLLSWKEY